jgi:hypothetical protein
MTIIDQLDEAAKNWNRTKNSKYKEEWYKLIKEFANGPYNNTRRNVDSCTSDQTNDGTYNII